MGRYNKYDTARANLSSGQQTMYDAIAANGAGLVKPFAEFSSDWKYAAAASGIAATTTAVTIKAAAAAGIKNYITALQITHATLGNVTEFAIRDGAGGAVLWRCTLATAAEIITVNFPTPIAGTAATLLEMLTLTSATGGVYVNVQGFTGP